MSCKSHGTNQSDVISTKDRVIVDKNELVCIEFVTGKEEECKVRDENNKVFKTQLYYEFYKEVLVNLRFILSA